MKRYLYVLACYEHLNNCRNDYFQESWKFQQKFLIKDKNTAEKCQLSNNFHKYSWLIKITFLVKWSTLRALNAKKENNNYTNANGEPVALLVFNKT